MILDEQNMKPSYWAVLPATVRYDEKIPASAKLIYAENLDIVGHNPDEIMEKATASITL